MEETTGEVEEEEEVEEDVPDTFPTEAAGGGRGVCSAFTRECCCNVDAAEVANWEAAG